MNRIYFLNLLKESLSLYDFVIYDLLIGELFNLLKQSGNEKSFLNVFAGRLEYLFEHGIHATVHKEFEPLGQGIYSMHITGKGFNVRVLYGFLSNQKSALLLAFYERGGHRDTDYSGQISVAAERLKELEEELL